ncbi:MAG: sodium/glutamate symporter [Gammaproteobacteria bacterium]|nr:sodium/glutamate symporter [Gammaproteobacteria bacterium]
MEMLDGVLKFDDFLSVTLGIVVLFIGKRINEMVPVLREFSIPEPVTGGLLLSLLITLVYFITDVGIEFELGARDILLVYFFTTIGINASFKDLISGGKPLAILLVITIGYMFLQNVTGIGVASLFGQEKAVGLIGGTVSLIGGHGTSIAWAPRFAENYGVANAMEIGVACATFGLVLASLMGGPVAKFLIQRHRLEPENEGEALDVGASADDKRVSLHYMELLDSVLAIHICIILGLLLDEGLENIGVQLPLFVSCLFAGIVMTNVAAQFMPRVLTKTEWPSRTPAIALVADVSLGTFLAMSLMSMQLWELIDLAGPIFAILGAQVLVAVIVILLVVFPVMGRNYDAAVISAGFGGFSMGATPTAMANMSAVTKRYGASHMAFIIVPLVGAFFIDIANAVIIQFFLGFI